MNAREGELIERSVPIIKAVPEAVKFGPVTSTLPGLEGTVAKATASTEGGKTAYVLNLAFTPKAKGTLRGNVTVTTDHPRFPKLDLHVYGNVTGDIALQPTRVTVSVTRQGATTVRATSRRGPFKITGTSEPQGLVDITPKPQGDGATWMIDLQPTDKAKASEKSIPTTVVLSTDSKEQPKLELPVFVHVPRAAP